MLLTAVSLCPTPTVSTKIRSKPAASQRSIASRVFPATPPKVLREGLGRMKARLSKARRSMRVLSPRILPFERELLGSTAKTATFLPASKSLPPKTSIKLLFPTPGTPVTPIRKDCPVCGNSSWIRAVANF